MKPSDVSQMYGAVPDEVVSDFVKACQSKKFNNILSFAKHMKREGYGICQLMNQILFIIIRSDELPDIRKAAIYSKMGVSFISFIISCLDSSELLSI